MAIARWGWKVKIIGQVNASKDVNVVGPLLGDSFYLDD